MQAHQSLAPILIIRHGQTDSNKNRVLQTPDTPLSELGLVQAERLAQHLAHREIGHIICSDHLRTQQTADAIVKLTSTKLTLSPLLRERNFGDLRGKAYDAIESDFFHPEYAPPNGETHPEFMQRIQLAWKFVLQSQQQTSGSLVVMTHGLVIRQLINRHLVVAEDTLLLSDYQNTCVTEVDARDKKTVLLWCDAGHLEKNTAMGAMV